MFTNSWYQLLRVVAGIIFGLYANATPAQGGSYAYFLLQPINSVAVVDASTDTVVATIGVDGPPQFLTTSPDGARVYVLTYDRVNVLDVAAQTNVASIQLQEGIRAAAVSPDSRTLYVASAIGGLWIIDAPTLQVQQMLPLEGSAAVATSADGKCVYAVHGSHISVIDSRNLVVRTITIPNVGSDSIALGHQPWAYPVNTPENGSVGVVSLPSSTFAGSITVGRNIQEIVRHPAGNLYAVDSDTREVIIIHGPSNQVRARIPMPMGVQPVAIDLLPSEDKAYVGGVRDDITGVFVVLDTRLRSVVKTVDLPAITFSKGRFISPSIVPTQVPAGCQG